MENLSEIRKRRTYLGIPLNELARAVGRSDSTLSRIERGQIRPSYDLVLQILNYLEAREGVEAPGLRAGDLMNRNLVFAEGTSTLAAAAQAMERGAYSQVPVVEGGKVTGSISETTILRALARPEGRRAKVRDVQEDSYPQVDEAFPADLLAGLLTRYPAVLVAHRGELKGILTKTDLIRGLRGHSLRKPAAPRPPGET
ncbi:MAG TPA: CBS domain-containing protein [Thermoplasmata archaeon]|nr:CBS domain-containing protein [Thermoplasmata archaeon]